VIAQEICGWIIKPYEKWRRIWKWIM
jgi:hypothetical protein